MIGRGDLAIVANTDKREADQALVLGRSPNLDGGFLSLLCVRSDDKTLVAIRGVGLDFINQCFAGYIVKPVLTTNGTMTFTSADR